MLQCCHGNVWIFHGNITLLKLIETDYLDNTLVYTHNIIVIHTFTIIIKFCIYITPIQNLYIMHVLTWHPVETIPAIVTSLRIGFDGKQILCSQKNGMRSPRVTPAETVIVFCPPGVVAE